MRRFLSGIMMFVMQFSASALLPIHVKATTDVPENMENEAQTEGSETEDYGDATEPSEFPENVIITMKRITGFG